MDSISVQIRELLAKADDDERRKIQNELQDSQTSVDTEWDILVRIGSGVLQAALSKVGMNLGVFEKLVNSASPVSLNDLVSETGAAPKMLGHIMRALASFGLVKETGQDEFTANRVTRALANENVGPAMDHAFDVHGHVALAFPKWLETHKYQDITTNTDLPFQVAMKTDLAPLDWMCQDPVQMKGLAHAMRLQREQHWIEYYPVEKEVGSFSAAADSALLVDIGGGYGQQANVFRNKFETLKGRIVVQDIPQTLDQAPAIEGIEFMAHDFFTPQPIKSAKFYYLRHVLHDWTDADSVNILKQIVPAMGPDSRVVIDEVVLPDKDVPWQAAYMDLTMMACLGGVERTKAEFEKVLDEAGLKIVEVKRYDPKMQSVIVAVPR